jgi:hypothetical protein
LLRLVSATTRLPLYRLAYHRYGRTRRAWASRGGRFAAAIEKWIVADNKRACAQ